MKISIDWHSTHRGVSEFDVDGSDLPEGFWNQRPHEQRIWLLDNADYVQNTTHRSEFEYDETWVSEE